MYGELGLFIDGAWRKNGGGNKGEDVLNPATEKPLAHLPHANTADLDEALQSAKKGFAVWRARKRVVAKPGHKRAYPSPFSGRVDTSDSERPSGERFAVAQ